MSAGDNVSSDIHRLDDHCDDVMQRVLSFMNLKCLKLVSKQWHRLSTLNESSQQRMINQMVREYQSAFLSRIKTRFPANRTFVVDRDSDERLDLCDVIHSQTRDGDTIMISDGHYALNVDSIARNLRIIGVKGDNVSFITSLSDLLVIRGSVYFENIEFQNMRMVVYGDLFIKNCTFKFSSRSGRFTLWMMGGTVQYLGCEFSGIDGIEMIEYDESQDVDIVGCKFVCCGKRRKRIKGQWDVISEEEEEQKGEEGGESETKGNERGVLNCVGNVFENNAAFPVMGFSRKVIGTGNILRGNNGFTMNQRIRL